MRMLLPERHDEVDVAAAYAPARPTTNGRPWVIGLMVATADGAATVDGRSGAIGGPADPEVFRAVRAAADAVMVGASTVAGERYGPVRTPPELVAARRARGQVPHPQAVVISGRLSLGAGVRLFAEADEATPRPLVVHTPGATGDRAPLTAVADLLEVPGAGDGVDLPAVVAELARRGHRVVVLEGGPTLNGAMVDADLVDELCLTLDPMVVGGRSPRIVVGGGAAAVRTWRPAHLLEHDGVLFWRLVRDRGV